MRLFLRLCVLTCLSFVAALALGQSWSSRYDEGLSAGAKGEWLTARESFRQAATYRPEDASQPTLLPGPDGTRIKWRNGLPYSPNFLSAYCRYRYALTESDEAKLRGLVIAAAELETLLDRGQSSQEAYYLLSQIYSLRNDTVAAAALLTRGQREPERAPWNVDASLLTPEEIAGAKAYVIRPPVERPVEEPIPIPGRVPIQPNKLALVIGNSEAASPGLGQPFATESARAIREALVVNAGYAESNVQLLLNAPAAKMLETARTLSERAADGGTVLIFYSGSGFNLNGDDYLMGTDGGSLSSSVGAVAKLDLFRPFLARGATVVALFESDRTVRDGHYFGSEVPAVGRIAQIQGTAPGEKVGAVQRASKSLGSFAAALFDVWAELKSNQNPIGDFGWAVYNRIGKMTGLPFRQTPSLPILTNISSETKF